MSQIVGYSPKYAENYDKIDWSDGPSLSDKLKEIGKQGLEAISRGIVRGTSMLHFLGEEDINEEYYFARQSPLEKITKYATLGVESSAYIFTTITGKPEILWLLGGANVSALALKAFYQFAFEPSWGPSQYLGD